jgi:glycogen synthase
MTIPRPRQDRGDAGAPLRILHLGFEDHAMPGSGGGSLRTHEVNRRLADLGHAVTVLVSRFPGCRDRVEDGVLYVHIGVGAGRNRWTRLFGYLARLRRAVARRAAGADLVVEDFIAPFSSVAARCWTGRPTIGMVQWLHARDKAREYHVPLHLVERATVRTHERLIAVSAGTAAALRALNPRARIDVVPNGVDPALLELTPRPGADVLYLGRLEVLGKGLDLLLEAWRRAAPRIPGDLVLAGDGPEEDKVRALASRTGVADRIRFVGRVQGETKHALLNESRIVAVPSRQETFGIVAVEAQAAGTPVVAFDIDCLRDVVPDGAGWLVPAFDVDRFADELVARYEDPAAAVEAGRRGRAFAAGYDWDAIARTQIDIYRSAAEPAAVGQA